MHGPHQVAKNSTTSSFAPGTESCDSTSSSAACAGNMSAGNVSAITEAAHERPNRRRSRM